MKQKKRKATKRNVRPKAKEIVIEETTRVAQPVVIRREPVTLSRALGEVAVVEPSTAEQVSRRVVQRVARKRKRA